VFFYLHLIHQAVVVLTRISFVRGVGSISSFHCFQCILHLPPLVPQKFKSAHVGRCIVGNT